MKQSFGQKGAGGRFLALALALIMLCSMLVPAYAAAVDEQRAVENQNEPVPVGVTYGVTYIFHVGETVYQQVKVLSGSVLTKPADPTAEGKVFAYWRLADGQEFTSFGTEVSTTQDETVALYAHFVDALPAGEAPAAEAPTQTPAQDPAAPEAPTEADQTPTGENQNENTENPTGENPDESATPVTPVTPETPTEPEPETPETPENPQPDAPADVLPAEETPTEPQPAEPQPAEGEPTEGEEQIIYTTDAQTPEALYERLMAVTSLEEMNSLLENLTEEQNAMMLEFSEEQNAALEAKMAELGAYEISTLANRELKITQGGSASVPVYRNTNIYDVKSELTNPATGEKPDISFSRNDNWRGYTVRVGAGVPAGAYTFTVTYSTRSYYYDDWQWKYTETEHTDTVTVTVEEAQPDEAMVFYLKTPTSDPKSNATSQWGTSVGNGSVKTNGATWTDDKNIFSPGAYVVSMPEGMVKQDDGSWLMPRTATDSNGNEIDYSSDYSAIYNAYKSELEKELGIKLTSDNDIEAIYLIPYKISKNNKSNPDKHIDCIISVKIKDDLAFTARFWVKTPGATNYTSVDSKNYAKNALVQETDKAPTDAKGDYPEKITAADGTVYVFDGWYNKFGTKVTFDYKPDLETELENGTVNFYAHYTPAVATLTIKKVVDGNMADHGKTFAFAYYYEGMEVSTENAKFELKHNEETTLNVPYGTTITITETANGCGTSWSYTYKDANENDVDGSDSDLVTSEDGSVKTCTLTVSANTTLTCTNTMHITPDTGIFLDSWPYFVALALVAAGAVLLFARRRRDAD